MKKLRILLLCLASLATTFAIATPAHAEERCVQAKVCFYVDKNYGGFRTNWWDDQAPINKKLRLTNHSESRTVSSINNQTPYYFNIWNSKGQRLCIPPGFGRASLGAWDNNVHYIGFYTSLC